MLYYYCVISHFKSFLPWYGYETADIAALMWDSHEGAMVRFNGHEYSSVIYKAKTASGKVYYGYTPPVRFESDKAAKTSSPGYADPLQHKIPAGAELVAHIHGHYWKEDIFRTHNEYFSPEDHDLFKGEMTYYLAGSDSRLLVYRKETGVIYQIAGMVDNKLTNNKYFENGSFQPIFVPTHEPFDIDGPFLP